MISLQLLLLIIENLEHLHSEGIRSLHSSLHKLFLIKKAIAIKAFV